MQTTQGSLVMVGLNTDTPEVFFNGAKINGVLSIAVDSRLATNKVTLKVVEDPQIADLLAAGVAVRRAVA